MNETLGILQMTQTVGSSAKTATAKGSSSNSSTSSSSCGKKQQQWMVAGSGCWRPAAAGHRHQPLVVTCGCSPGVLTAINWQTACFALIDALAQAWSPITSPCCDREQHDSF